MSILVHPQSICESTHVGEGTRIWAFAHVLPGARIGRDCNICDHVFVEDDVVIGDRVTVKCGVQLWNGVRLGDDVFVGPNATFTNDKKPRSKQYQSVLPETTVKSGASLGANCTILPGVKIAGGVMVGAGAVVTHDVPPNAIVVGNPARITGYVDATQRTESHAHGFTRTNPEDATPVVPLIGDATLHILKTGRDLRGSLAVAQFGDEIPFVPKRAFVVYDVPSKDTRGEHAHKACRQFLICLRGSLSVLLDDGAGRTEVVLDRPDQGLYMPPLMWGTQFKFTDDALLLVLASDWYDPEDYIRDYAEFVALVNAS